MLFYTILQVAFRSLVANKLRSFLTMLGVIIGVAAVIAMLALAGGARERITAQVRSQGANLLIIWPDSRGAGPVRTQNANTLTIMDAESILTRMDTVARVSPESDSSRQQVKYFSANNNYSVQGVTPTYFAARNVQVQKGRAMTDSENQRAARVAVIGAKVATDLFGTQDPLGETVKIRGSNFLVIGVTRAKGEGWNSPDERVLVPLQTALTQLLGRASLGSIAVQFLDGTDMPKAQEDLTALVRRLHRISGDRENDFRIFNMQEIQDQLQMVATIFTLLLGGVASISLLVGGIGIMNIMLVAVTERTREIGVRKALGARNRDVLAQFLTEAVVVSVLGGAIGVVLALSVIWGYNGSVGAGPESIQAIIQPWSIGVAFAFSVLIGVFFGWYPARQAARLDPIDALRYE
jgi:putative ABC transport system permease protein